MAESKRPQAVYEPGELARTREKLGALSAEDAKNLAKKLGGVVGVEKGAQIDPSAIKRINKPPSSGAANSSAKSRPEIPKSKTPRPSAPSSVSSAGAPVQKTILPALTPRERRKMDLLMMSPDFQIKKNYGIFNFFYFLSNDRNDNILNSFVKKTLPRHLNHMQLFNEAVFTILKLSPDTYKQKIMNPTELHLKLLKKLASWPKMFDDVKTQYRIITDGDFTVTLEMLVPFIRAFYKMLLQIYYLGEQPVNGLFKAVFDDIASFPDAKKKELVVCMRSVTAEWSYVCNKITESMYPILMRMCGTRCMERDEFFITEVSKILSFLGMTKFDILVPEKKKGDQQDVIKTEKEQSEVEQAVQSEKEEKAREAAEIRHDRFKLTETGLKLLDLMFPGAQWLSLSLSTDMFTYFQPIYQFPDGVNLLAPQNPIQMIVVLLRILEDFMRGCRNITFDLPPELSQGHNDTFGTAMTEWMSYREVLFEKNYSTDLKDYVNNLYSKSDFAHTPIGKKLMFNLMWQTKQYFLPFFKVDSISLERPSSREVTLRHLSTRVMFLREIFAELAAKIDAASQTREEIPELPNAWEKYKFDLDNAVSLRLDVLLGAKKNSPMAVNASIVKYTAAVLAVLDWWINDETSPARDQDNFKLFRTSPIDGRPAFSADLRTDTDALFKKNLKKLAGQRAAGQKQQTGETPKQPAQAQNAQPQADGGDTSQNADDSSAEDSFEVSDE